MYSHVHAHIGCTTYYTYLELKSLFKSEEFFYATKRKGSILEYCYKKGTREKIVKIKLLLVLLS